MPNSVTSDNIKYGIHIERNPVVLSTMEKIPAFRYSGRDSGIPMVMRLCRDAGLHVELINDTDTTRFIARVSGRAKQERNIIVRPYRKGRSA